MAPKPEILVIVGPTAAGKSGLAVSLAKKFNGEVISADSRQIYRGLDLGSGKVPRDRPRAKSQKLATDSYLHQGVPHHLLDVASPRQQFSVARYQKLAAEKIVEILNRGKLPIICGGSGFYIRALTDGLILPRVGPNQKLRAKLGKKGITELVRILKRLDPERAENIDLKNPRRLIRAIEIATKLGRVPKLQQRTSNKYRFVIIGLKPNLKKLRKNIRDRLEKRLRAGLLDEVAGLKKSGLSWKRLDKFGLEYRYLSTFLRSRWRDFRRASEPAGRRVKREEIMPAAKQLETAIWRYAKRQLTWFKSDKRIIWCATKKQAEKSASRWLRK